MVLQGDAVQSITLLDISGQVDYILYPLPGGAPPQPLPASWPQLIVLPVLLRQVVLRAIVTKQIGMTTISRLHHGGWLETIVLASTGHFFFPVLTETEIGASGIMNSYEIPLPSGKITWKTLHSDLMKGIAQNKGGHPGKDRIMWDTQEIMCYATRQVRHTPQVDTTDEPKDAIQDQTCICHNWLRVFLLSWTVVHVCS